jgi:hypothetical protein
VAAKLSGHFSEQATEEHLDAILAKTETGGMTGLEDTIKQYFNGIDPIPLTKLIKDYKSAHFPVAYYIGDWLILPLPNDDEIDEDDLPPAMAALAKLQAHGAPLKSVAIFGMKEKKRVVKGPDGKGIKDKEGDPIEEKYIAPSALGITTTSTAATCGLSSALEDLAKKASGPDYFLGRNIAIACLKHAMSVEKPGAAPRTYESEIYGSPPFSKGDIHDSHGRLIAPARYRPEKALGLFKEALKGCTYLADSKLLEKLQENAKK